MGIFDFDINSLKLHLKFATFSNSFQVLSNSTAPMHSEKYENIKCCNDGLMNLQLNGTFPESKCTLPAR